MRPRKPEPPELRALPTSSTPSKPLRTHRSDTTCQAHGVGQLLTTDAARAADQVAVLVKRAGVLRVAVRRGLRIIAHELEVLKHVNRRCRSTVVGRVASVLNLAEVVVAMVEDVQRVLMPTGRLDQHMLSA